VHSVGVGVDCCHCAGQFVVDMVLDRHGAEIRILAIEAAFGRLIGVLEPVIADDCPLAQRRADVSRKATRALGLRLDLRPGAAGVGQAGVGGAKRKLADQARLAGGGINVDRLAGIELVAIE
jgi:hypothetical protein